MKYKCPKCQNIFEGEVSFCPHCGSKMRFPGKEPAKSEPIATSKVEEPPLRKEEDSTRFNTRFEKSLIFEFVSNLFIFLLSISLLFIPFFVNLRTVGGEVVSSNFSLFNVTLDFFRNISSGGFYVHYFIFELVLTVYLFVIIIFSLVMFIKNINSLTHIENYYLVRYDNLINRVEEPRIRIRRGPDSLGFLVSSIMLFIFAIIFDRMPYVGMLKYDGVNGLLTFPLSFFAVALTFAILKLVLNSKIKNALLKEKYQRHK